MLPFESNIVSGPMMGQFHYVFYPEAVHAMLVVWYAPKCRRIYKLTSVTLRRMMRSSPLRSFRPRRTRSNCRWRSCTFLRSKAHLLQCLAFAALSTVSLSWRGWFCDVFHVVDSDLGSCLRQTHNLLFQSFALPSTLQRLEDVYKEGLLAKM